MFEAVFFNLERENESKTKYYNEKTRYIWEIIIRFRKKEIKLIKIIWK